MRMEKYNISSNHIEFEKGITINSAFGVNFMGQVCFRRSKISLVVDSVLGLEKELFMDDQDFLNFDCDLDLSRRVLAGSLRYYK